MGRFSGSGEGLPRRKLKKTAEAENSGELVRQPGGVFSRGRRGEKCGRAWGLNRGRRGNKSRPIRVEFGNGFGEESREQIPAGG